MKMLWVCAVCGCHKVSHVVRLRRLKPLRNMMRRVQSKAIDVDRTIGELSTAAEQPGQLQPLIITISIMPCRIKRRKTHSLKAYTPVVDTG